MEQSNRQINKTNAIEDYFQNVIKKSWTWNKLTEKEKQRFININFDYITGTTKQRQYAMMTIYEAFLMGVGYDNYNWREN